MIKKTIDSLDFCVRDADVWMISGDCNALLKYNIQSKQLRFVSFFPDNNTSRKYGYIKTMNYGDELFFVPAWADNFVSYDMVGNRFKVYNDIALNKGGKFGDAFISGDRLYCIPLSTDKEILVLNLPSMEVIDRFVVSKSIQNELNRCYCYQKHIYMCVPGKNMLIDFDEENRCSDIISIEGTEELNAISGFQRTVFLHDNGSEKIIKYDICDRRIIDELFDEEKTYEVCAFDGERVFVSSRESSLKKVDFTDRSIHEVNLRDELINIKNKYTDGVFRNVQGFLYYFDRLSSSLVTFNGSDFDCYKLTLNEDDSKTMLKEIIDKSSEMVLSESRLFSVEDFVKSL